jgi:isopentenyl-diphosphate delta-isomerase
VYRVQLEDGLIEHEYDHVLIGNFDGVPNPSRQEVSEWKWIDLATLRVDTADHPERYTYWFRISLEQLCQVIEPKRFNFAGTTMPIPSNG